MHRFVPSIAKENAIVSFYSNFNEIVQQKATTEIGNFHFTQVYFLIIRMNIEQIPLSSFSDMYRLHNNSTTAKPK